MGNRGVDAPSPGKCNHRFYNSAKGHGEIARVTYRINLILPPYYLLLLPHRKHEGVDSFYLRLSKNDGCAAGRGNRLVNKRLNFML